MCGGQGLLGIPPVLHQARRDETLNYDPELERGIAFDDPDLGIEWPDLDRVVSERDAQAPRLAQIAHELPFEY